MFRPFETSNNDTFDNYWCQVNSSEVVSGVNLRRSSRIKSQFLRENRKFNFKNFQHIPSSSIPRSSQYKPHGPVLQLLQTVQSLQTGK